MASSYWVYILYSGSRDRYYVGSTGDLEDRLRRHNEGRSQYTRSGAPWELVHSEGFATRSEAYQRERFIKKKKSRAYIESLIVS